MPLDSPEQDHSESEDNEEEDIDDSKDLSASFEETGAAMARPSNSDSEEPPAKNFKMESDLERYFEVCKHIRNCHYTLNVSLLLI